MLYMFVFEFSCNLQLKMRIIKIRIYKYIEVSSDIFRLEMMWLVVVDINNSELGECHGCCSSQAHLRSMPVNMNSTEIIGAQLYF